MTTKPIRVAIYVRVSTEEQAEHGYSIDAQLDTLRNYCKSYGNQIYCEYVDRGVSGKSMEGRFELQRLLKDAEKNLFDEVLVWKINRLARKNLDLLTILDKLEKQDISFRSLSENIETETIMGKLTLQVLGAIGEMERSTIVENVKMGLNQRAKTGMHNGKLPLGYQSVPDTNDSSGRSKAVTVPDEALIIQKIYELYASGKGLKSIANQLNHSSYKTKTGIAFSTSAVKEILCNPIYNGKVRYNRHENWSEKRRRGLNYTPIIVEGRHEAIISEDLWKNVQQLREKKAIMPSRTFNGEYLLTGIIRCPQCGAAMVASRTRNKSKSGEIVNRMYYVCGNFRSKGSSVCSSNSVHKHYAEEEISKRLSKVLSKESILKAIVNKTNAKLLNRTFPLQQQLTHIDTQIQITEAKKRKYLDLYELGQFDKSLFSNRIQEIQVELNNYHTEKSRIELELVDDNTQPITFEQVQILISQFEQLLASTSLEKRKTLLHLVIKRITLDENRKIATIELTFDEKIENYFFNLNPSAFNADGVSCTSSGHMESRKQINIVI